MVVGDAGLGPDLAAGGDDLEGRGVRAPQRVGEIVALSVGGGNGAADVLVRDGVLVNSANDSVGAEGHAVDLRIHGFGSHDQDGDQGGQRQDE